MFRNVSYRVLGSRLALTECAPPYSKFFEKMPSNNFFNRKQSMHATPSSSNIAIMPFGTGRVYVKSHRCIAVTVGIFLVALVFSIFGMHGDRILPAAAVSIFRNTRLQYGIMMDAGSTGSRVHVYEFVDDGAPPPILQNEVFEQVKPGLSSFADNPQEGVRSIESLLDIAKKSIPRDMWSSTPLALKATAGLRLLPGGQAQVLLDGVNKLFHSSPFKIGKDPVVIMNGTDEGIYAWLTVNYLLNLIKQDTVGTIDLGGGSMQITFAPVEAETIRASPEQFIQEKNIFNEKLKVYVHSYLGLGLMSTRELVLSGPEPSSLIDVTSPCLPEGYTGDWTNAQTKYSLKGTKAGKGKFEACREVTKKAIAGKIHRPDELQRETFYAFSYYFDRAAENGIIHPENGGVISVRKYEDTARNVCENIDRTTDTPFMCMDLSIITTFLRDGFGFSPDTYLNIRKKINGKENSWALGANIFLMNNEI